MNNLILCDCFGVILEEVAVGWFRDHFDDPKVADTLKDKYFVKVDLGEMPMDEVFYEIEKDLGFDHQELKEDWYRRINLKKEVLDFIDELRARGDTVVMLSNAGYPFIHDMIDKYSLKNHFDKIFVSCDYHLIKPDKEFYKVALNSFTKPFDRIYMIDDSPRNLKPLPELGIIGLLFTNLELLKKALRP